MSDEEFDRCRAEVLRQYHAALTLLRDEEQSRHDRVNGWELEMKITFVHARIRPKPPGNPFFGIARQLEDTFSAEQRSVIYCLLLDMVDHVPWAGIDHDALWKTVFQRSIESESEPAR